MQILQAGSLSYHTDPLLNMIALFNLVDHGDCVIRIADDALAFRVENQFFAAENVFAGALAFRLKIVQKARMLLRQKLPLSIIQV